MRQHLPCKASDACARPMPSCPPFATCSYLLAQQVQRWRCSTELQSSSGQVRACWRCSVTLRGVVATQAAESERWRGHLHTCPLIPQCETFWGARCAPLPHRRSPPDAVAELGDAADGWRCDWLQGRKGPEQPKRSLKAAAQVGASGGGWRPNNRDRWPSYGCAAAGGYGAGWETICWKSSVIHTCANGLTRELFERMQPNGGAKTNTFHQGSVRPVIATFNCPSLLQYQQLAACCAQCMSKAHQCFTKAAKLLKRFDTPDGVPMARVALQQVCVSAYKSQRD